MTEVETENQRLREECMRLQAEKEDLTQELLMEAAPPPCDQATHVGHSPWRQWQVQPGCISIDALPDEEPEAPLRSH